VSCSTNRGIEIYFFLIFRYRAIILTWFVIITTAIPVGISHGEVYYPHKGENNTVCTFLVNEGYHHAAFQVKRIKKIDSIPFPFFPQFSIDSKLMAF
jgi:hypothetical protein